MRAIISLAILGLGSLASGFPDRTGGSAHTNCPYAALKERQDPELGRRFLLDPMSKPIDVTGVHAFQPPKKGDQRGPCPALNALANHGYISRSGVVSFAEVIAAVNKVYGMGVDLTTILALMGLVWTGNPLALVPSFSIGGRDTGVNNLLNNLGGLLGEPQGLIGSHNFIEADSSNTRDDLYVTGNNYALNMDKFMEWYNMSTDGTFSMDLMAERAKIRFEQSIQTNPEFYYGPVTGLIARNAGYMFPGRLFRNHSRENPEGVLTKGVVRNFYGIYGEEGNLTYREGWERIPENWYKTPVDYGLVQLNIDLVDWMIKHPELASIGGNTGTVNSFTGVNLADVTGGVLNLTTLLEGNNLLCFVFEVLKFASPNALAGVYKTLAAPLDLINKIIAVPLLDMSCPAFKDMQMGGRPLWDAIKDDFPGAMKSGGAL
ncbi:peroxidase family protein [Aspergillus novofumigatus IBT 16806]|uniref:Cloroperoxidase n=1 Tax=Aspergillus novofumigatus (strain IBT 16806) TaxID=1392255 RepID=A0A2I1CFF6_ASPN1|nr:Cloroperoxidase [Aspergillus novofumigatus IBT 16806]PKX96328.1 Cloroperoxidase [Aspergillus novofumigatus IBT 16806]